MKPIILFIFYIIVSSSHHFTQKKQEEPKCWCLSGILCCPNPGCEFGYQRTCYDCLCWINQNRKSYGYTGGYTFCYYPYGPFSDGECDWCVDPSSPLKVDIKYDYHRCIPYPKDPCRGYSGEYKACSDACWRFQNETKIFIDSKFQIEWDPGSGVEDGFCECYGYVDPCRLPVDDDPFNGHPEWDHQKKQWKIKAIKN